MVPGARGARAQVVDGLGPVLVAPAIAGTDGSISHQPLPGDDRVDQVTVVTT